MSENENTLKEGCAGIHPAERDAEEDKQNENKREDEYKHENEQSTIKAEEINSKSDAHAREDAQVKEPSQLKRDNNGPEESPDNLEIATEPTAPTSGGTTTPNHTAPNATEEERSESSFWSSEEEEEEEEEENQKPNKSVPSRAAKQPRDGMKTTMLSPLEVEQPPPRTHNEERVHGGIPKFGGSISDSDEDSFDHIDNCDDLNGVFFEPAESNRHELSVADLEICEKLDQEYDRALEEREIGYNARYESVRQSACCSISFMGCYIVLGTLYLTLYVKWEVEDALFFSIYTMTTVGYGLQPDNIPNERQFQVFVIFYIFVGIATLTIMVAQVYQCIALEATRAQHARDKAEMSRRGKKIIMGSPPHIQASMRFGGLRSSHQIMTEFEQMHSAGNLGEKIMDFVVLVVEKAKIFFRENEVGRSVSVLFPLIGLVSIGALVVGPIEGWTVTQSIYFACVSLTTVGYGLYVPKNPISIWFCIFWLPFSVGFMSLFLGNVASFYIRLSDKNINRLERNVRRRLKKAKEEAAKEREAVLKRALRGQTDVLMGTEDNEAVEPPQEVSAKSVSGGTSTKTKRGFNLVAEHDDGQAEEASKGKHRHTILDNYRSSFGDESSIEGERTVQTMRDILTAVKHNLTMNESSRPLNKNSLDDDSSHASREGEFFSLKPVTRVAPASLRKRNSVTRKPAFALRVLVQERFAEIIAAEIAGFQSQVEIKENTLSVTIDTLKETADKWLVPRRARKAFRAVAFEALYFVGEHGLITRGADALYDLSPFEFHGLFSPLLAAMGDSDTMEGWLAGTRVLAGADLFHQGQLRLSTSTAGPSGAIGEEQNNQSDS